MQPFYALFLWFRPLFYLISSFSVHFNNLLGDFCTNRIYVINFYLRFQTFSIRHVDRRLQATQRTMGSSHARCTTYVCSREYASVVGVRWVGVPHLISEPFNKSAISELGAHAA